MAEYLPSDAGVFRRIFEIFFIEYIRWLLLHYNIQVTTRMTRILRQEMVPWRKPELEAWNHSSKTKKKLSNALREKCPYSEFFWSVFPRIRTRKTRTTGTFHAVLDISRTNTTESSALYVPKNQTRTGII